MTPKQRKRALAKARAEIAAIRKHASAKREEILELINGCEHPQTTRTADPSGGHDHAYTCLICGKEW